ncbi:MAG: hypothetical protein LBR80_05635 [Deltaproteobacteria bacterium]|nr:hypothetical protein [Deltaproteobacteria bacterium]
MLRLFLTNLLGLSSDIVGLVLKGKERDPSLVAVSLSPLPPRLRASHSLPAASNGEFLSGKGPYAVSLAAGNVRAVLKVFRILGLDRLISSEECREREIVLGLVAAFVLYPSRGDLLIQDIWAVSALAEELRLDGVTSADASRALEWLAPLQPEIQRKLAARHLVDGDPVLTDRATVAFPAALVRGVTKAAKRGAGTLMVPGPPASNSLRITIALAADREGRPVAVRALPGNSQGSYALRTVSIMVSLGLKIAGAVMVGDRRMIDSDNVRFLKQRGMGWLTMLTENQARQASRDAAAKFFSKKDSLGPGEKGPGPVLEISSKDFPSERLFRYLRPHPGTGPRPRRKGDKPGVVWPKSFLPEPPRDPIRTVLRTSLPIGHISPEECVRLFGTIKEVQSGLRIMKPFRIELTGNKAADDMLIKGYTVVWLLSSYVVFHIRDVWHQLASENILPNTTSTLPPLEVQTPSADAGISLEAGRTSPDAAGTSAEAAGTSAEAGRTSPDDAAISPEDGQASADGAATSPEDWQASADGAETSPEDGRAPSEDGRIVTNRWWRLVLDDLAKCRSYYEVSFEGGALKRRFLDADEATRFQARALELLDALRTPWATDDNASGIGNG